jgi:hypothetical protein
MISIKPHHFVDIITAIGDGRTEFQPHPYGHAVHTVSTEILADPDVTLRIELGSDDICSPCQHNIGGDCDDTIDTSFRPQAPESKKAYNLLIDKRWCEGFGFQQNDALTARQFCLRLRDGAGDIEDIYKEMPSDRTDDRQKKLKRGITLFLQ